MSENYGLKNKGGRKPKLTPRDNRRILKAASNSYISRREIVSNLQLSVSKWTIGRVLKKFPNIRCEKMKGKPLTKAHKINRLEWAKKYMSWKAEWNSDVSRDEKMKSGWSRRF